MILKRKTIIITFIILFVLALLICLILIDNDINSKETFEEKGQPKIAFLFLTYNNLNRPDIWNKFLDTQSGNTSKYAKKYTIYLHAKEPENISDSLLRGKHIPENIETCWGCFGSVEANILMMKEALKDPLNKKFILVSESCIPIVSFNYLYEELMKNNKNRIYLWENNNTMYRYDHITNPEFDKSRFLKNDGQGIILNRETANFFVNTLYKNKNKWKNMECVDEHYFSNILYSNLKSEDKFSNENKVSTYTSWYKKKININNIDPNDKEALLEYNKYEPSPTAFKIFTRENIYDIKQQGFLFARKVDKNTNVDTSYL